MFRSTVAALALTVVTGTATVAQVTQVAPAVQPTPAAPAVVKAPVAVPVTALKAPPAAAPAAAKAVAVPAVAKAKPVPTADAAAKAAAPAKVAAPKKCMRLPLSDIAVGRDETIAQARMRLGEYAEAEAKTRKWGATSKSLETVSCDVYLVLPLIGTEYKCLVTATFCTK